MTMHYLIKKGYGTLKEVCSLDSRDVLNAMEYDSILNDIERYQSEKD
jgi:hypothetical protein